MELLQDLDGLVEQRGLVGAALARNGLHKGRLVQVQEDVDNVAQQVARAEIVLFLVLHLERPRRERMGDAARSAWHAPLMTDASRGNAP